MIDLKLTKDTGGSRDGPRARSDFGDFVFPGDILTTEATTLDATTSSPNTNIDSSPDPEDITTISLQVRPLHWPIMGTYYVAITL